MTVDDYVCDGIDKLMADAAGQAAEFTDASGTLTIAFLDAADVLRTAWHAWLAQKVREEEDADGDAETNLPADRD